MGGFKLGELITVSKPYAYVLDDDQRGLRCDCCFKQLESSKQCGRCSFVYYCNRSCQVQAWQYHKNECRLLMNARIKPSSDIRLLTLIIFKYKKYGPDDPFEETHGRRVTFGTLMSHAEDIKKDPKANLTAKAAMETVRNFIGDQNMPSFDKFIEIYGKKMINSFSIYDEITLLGSGLYLGGSVFDHSCNPNAAYVHEGVDLWIRACRPIKGRDISKVYVSYTSRWEPTKNRQTHLMSHYYFLCQCSHCTSSERDELMTKTRVNEDVGSPNNTQIQDLMELVSITESLEKIATLSFLFEASVGKLKELLETRSLPDTHITMVAAFRILSEFYMVKGELSEALLYGTKLLEANRLYLGPYHSAIGFNLLHLSQLHLSQGNITAASVHFKEAKKVLKVILGEEHSKYQELFG